MQSKSSTISGSNTDFRNKSASWKMKSSSNSIPTNQHVTSISTSSPSSPPSLSTSTGTIPSLSNISILLAMTRRLPQDSSALRRSKSSSGSEGATIAQRRKMIIDAPIDDLPMSNEVIVAL